MFADIPPHNPLDIIDGLLRGLEEGAESMRNQTLRPWFKDFKGVISLDSTSKTSQNSHPCFYTTSGIVKPVNTTEVVISELPVGVWTQSYKEWLQKLTQSGGIKGYREEHSESSVSFLVKMTRQGLAKAKKQSGGLDRFFKLQNKKSLNNMHLIGSEDEVG